MGRERIVDDTAGLDLAAALAALAASGLPCVIAMIDGALVMPGAAAPAAWGEVRLRSPAGMVTLARRGGALAVTVFGNADAALLDAQERVARAIEQAAATAG